MNKTISMCGLAALVVAGGCGCEDNAANSANSSLSISAKDWGKAPDGSALKLYTLTDGKGTTVRISNWGAILQSLETPDRDGKSADIILGFDSIDGYVPDTSYQGAGIGRYGNRIGGAKFSIDGVEYQLTKNEGENCLHGGKPGYDKVVWKSEPVEGKDSVAVKLTRLSPDGENGFPGNLDVTITIALNTQKEIAINYEATTDKATAVNLTHHMYYNLTGRADADILGHQLMMKADRMTPVDAALIPTGEITPVKGTPFDFQSTKAVGADINADDVQLKLGGGYDHNFVFAKADGKLLHQVTLTDPESGRIMEMLTTEPAIQFYSGNFLSGAPGKSGRLHKFRNGLCLETQHYPDSPNHANFPSTILRPGQKYESTTVLRFSAK